MNFLAKMICTVFGVGFLPLVPGTFGSLAGLGIYFLVKDNLLLYTAAALIVTALGFIFGNQAERALGKKDPRQIVIDEVSGMLLSLFFLPFSPQLVIAGFIIFRILDTFKPYPAGALQSLRGAAGIMVDDIIAAIYTNILLQVVVRFSWLRNS